MGQSTSWVQLDEIRSVRDICKKLETRTIASKTDLNARRLLAKLERCCKNNAGEMPKIAKNWD